MQELLWNPVKRIFGQKQYPFKNKVLILVSKPTLEEQLFTTSSEEYHHLDSSQESRDDESIDSQIKDSKIYEDLIFQRYNREWISYYRKTTND